MGPCWERPIPRAEFTPEKGREQLDRMRACYDRQRRIKLTFVIIYMVGFLIVLASVLLVAVGK
jgi:predicted nucleic acid-binding Zn ribbon protein